MPFISLGQYVEVIQQMWHMGTICGYLVFFFSVKNLGVFVVDGLEYAWLILTSILTYTTYVL